MNEHTASGEDASRDSRRRETDRLFRERRRAGARERRDLLDEVVCLNMEVARDLARRYRGRGVPDDDLEQVAYLGLVKAVRGFDVDRADDFLSYAVPTIRGEVRRYFRDHGWMVRPSRTIQESPGQDQPSPGGAHAAPGPAGPTGRPGRAPRGGGVPGD